MIFTYEPAGIEPTFFSRSNLSSDKKKYTLSLWKYKRKEDALRKGLDSIQVDSGMGASSQL